jgi:hypothetical protein
MQQSLAIITKVDGIAAAGQDVPAVTMIYQNKKITHQAVNNQAVRIAWQQLANGQRQAVTATLINNNIATNPRVTRAHLQAFEDLTGSHLFTRKSQYREFKKSLEWQAIYEVRTAKRDHYDFHADQIVKRDIDLVFCRSCGLELPLAAATMDHQAPVKGGRPRALCRFFRALGLTCAPGHGLKSEYYSSQLAARVGGNSAGDPTKRKERYTLNDIGTIYYSLLYHNHDWAITLGERCLHSIFNLRPVCPSCNSSLKNSNVL